MKIAIFCAFDTPETIEYALATVSYLEKKGHELDLDSRLIEYISKPIDHTQFEASGTINLDIDFLFSIGGDGTLLRSIPFVKDSKIPILGINTGRLGFLTSLQKETLNEGLDEFFDEKFKLVERSLLSVALSDAGHALNNSFSYALNEISINRMNTTSMLSIQTKINEEYLTTYWADGLIIATSTGSTGYSLSSNGPILTPETKGIILNPIAPHNLNIRPLVVPDEVAIKISVDGRGDGHLMSLDSRLFTVENGSSITIKKAAFPVFTVELNGDNYFKTLRNKLFWGQDTRNRQ
jgi:NAD+ kinase